MTATTIPIGLTNLFGLELDSFQTYQPPSRGRNAVRFEDSTTVPIHVFAEVLRPTAASIVGRWDRDYLTNSPAATERRFGMGKAVYYGSLFNLEAARYLTKRYAAELGLRPLLDDAPAQVEVTCRTRGDSDFYFVLNHGDTPIDVKVGPGFVDLVTDGVAPASFTLAPFDYRVLKGERRNRLAAKTR